MPKLILIKNIIFKVSGINVVNTACLHNNQTPKEREIIVEKLSNGELSILLLSPEAVVSGFNTEWLSKLPSIAFACLDEAHCLSQWSHNFRPSYLMICQVIYTTNCLYKIYINICLGFERQIWCKNIFGINCHSNCFNYFKYSARVDVG